MSTAPSTRPVRGSCTGAAAQVHGCTRRMKCSAANTCTGRSTATAVPGAFVPTARLRPPRARHEVHPPRLPPGRRMPLDPQQPAVRVAHREQMLAVGGEGPHQLTEQRHHPRQRMLGPVGAEVPVAELDARRPVGPDAGPRGTPPRVGHHRAHRPLHRARLGERLVRAPQQPRRARQGRPPAPGPPMDRSTRPPRKAMRLGTSSLRVRAQTTFSTGVTRMTGLRASGHAQFRPCLM